MFDVEAYYSHIGAIQAPPGHRHARDGWIQTACPFCMGSDGYHLGYNTQAGYFNCWRCGWHSELDVIATLSHCTYSLAKELLATYQNGISRKVNKEVKWGKVSETKLPSELPLQSRDIQYLSGRGVDAKKVEALWGLRGSKIIGDYKYRIIIPIHFGGRVVSYQGRIIRDGVDPKYKACRMEDEAIHHKTILYGLDRADAQSPVILVEGVVDAWAIGPGALASFGIDTMVEQINQLAHFPKVYVFFDPEPQAQARAKGIVAELLMRGTEAIHVPPGRKDPGSSTRKELRRSLPFWTFRD